VWSVVRPGTTLKNHQQLAALPRSRDYFVKNSKEHQKVWGNDAMLVEQCRSISSNLENSVSKSLLQIHRLRASLLLSSSLSNSNEAASAICWEFMNHVCIINCQNGLCLNTHQHIKDMPWRVLKSLFAHEMTLYIDDWNGARGGLVIQLVKLLQILHCTMG
jgi:hypothetical protein